MALDLGTLVAFLGLDATGAQEGAAEGESHLKTFAKNAASITRNAGIAAGIAFAGALAANMDIEAGRDKLQAALGLTGAQAERAGQVAANLYKGAWGESLEDTQNAVEEVMSSIKGMRNASGADLEALTIKAMDLSTAMEVEVADAARVAGRLIDQGIAKDGTEAFDLLTRAMQKVPKSLRQDILEITDEYAGFYSAVGFGAEEMYEQLVQGSKLGSWGIDKAADLVAEFSKIGFDESKTRTDAFKAIGLDATQMADDIAAGGDRAQDAFQAVVDGLNSMKDPSDRANTAIALFGTPFEDVVPQQINKTLKVLGEGSGAMDGFAGSADHMGKVLNDNAKTNLTSFMRQVKMAGIGLAEGAIPYVNRTATFLATKFGPAAKVAGTMLREEVLPPVRNAVTWLRDKFLPPLTRIGNVIMDKLVPAFVGLWDAYKDDVATGIGIAFTAAGEGVDLLLAGIEKVIPVLADMVTWLGDNKDIVIGVAAVWAAWKVGLIAMTAVTKLQAAATAVWAGAQLAWNGVMYASTIATWAFNAAWAANPIGLVLVAITALVAAFVILWRRSETFRGLVTGLWDGMKGFGGWVKDTFVAVLHAGGRAFTWVKEKAAGAFGWVKDNWPLLLAIITGPIGWAVLAVAKNWDRIKAGAGAAKDFITTKFSALIDWFRNMPDRMKGAAGDVWGWLKDAFRKALNWLIEKWNALDLTLSFEAPGWVPKIGGKGWTSPDVFPDIPMLANGGVVTGPTLALVGEGDEDEVVSPLSKYQSQMDRAYAHGARSVSAKAPAGRPQVHVGNHVPEALRGWVKSIAEEAVEDYINWTEGRVRAGAV